MMGKAKGERWKDTKKAHAAAKHCVGQDAESYISEHDYTILMMLVKMAIAVTVLVAAYHAAIFVIDGFEGLMRAAVIHGANPFGWS